MTSGLVSGIISGLMSQAMNHNFLHGFAAGFLGGMVGYGLTGIGGSLFGTGVNGVAGPFVSFAGGAAGSLTSGGLEAYFLAKETGRTMPDPTTLEGALFYCALAAFGGTVGATSGTLASNAVGPVAGEQVASGALKALIKKSFSEDSIWIDIGATVAATIGEGAALGALNLEESTKAGGIRIFGQHVDQILHDNGN